MDSRLSPARFSLFRRHSAQAGAFVGDENGATAVEFAMIMVPFFGLIGGTIEIGMAYFRTAQLQVAVETASRSILTNRLSGNISPADFVKQKLCTWKTTGKVEPGTLGRMFDCDKVYVSIDAPDWWDPDAINDSTLPNQSTAMTLPDSGEIAVVKVFYPVRPMINMLGLSAGGDITKITPKLRAFRGAQNVYLLTAVTAFRVEPDL